MAVNIEVSCIRKRGDHFNPHERIEGLGGMDNGKRWYKTEEVIIAEISKPDDIKKLNYYVSVNMHDVPVIIETKNGRKYLKTPPDGYSPDNLLSLPECPRP